MSLKPQPDSLVPADTLRVAKAAFAKGNPYLTLQDELGPIFEDADFTELFSEVGQSAIPPWRLALVTIMQFRENLSDRQAAEAVRSRIDWKYLLRLELTNTGFNYSVLSEFRGRLLPGKVEHLLLDKLLERCRELGLVKAGGQQRTDSTRVLGAIRSLNRLEVVGETLRAALSEGEVIAIDGKTLRHSYDTGRNKGAIHMVSAWASQNRLVLGQVKVDEKSNEITAIPQLLKVLDLHGCIVTIDAMGAQKDIAQQIIEAGGEYVLSLKGNQGNLHQDVDQLFQWTRKIQFKDIAHEFHQTIESAHGRVELRRYWLLGGVEHLMDAHLWAGLQRVGLVESERRLAGREPTIEQRYYLLSFNGGVKRFAQSVRSHWGIENQVHWVLDVAFDEDASRVRKDHAPENLALIRHVALNLLRQDPSAKGGIKAKRLKAGWDNRYLSRLLAA